MLDISPYPTLIQLKYFIGRIHYFVIIFGKWFFDKVCLIIICYCDIEFKTMRNTYLTVEEARPEKNIFLCGINDNIINLHPSCLGVY